MAQRLLAATMASSDLARWQRFAGKGGIGKSTALVDCVAERDGDLMFLKVCLSPLLLVLLLILPRTTRLRCSCSFPRRVIIL